MNILSNSSFRYHPAQSSEIQYARTTRYNKVFCCMKNVFLQTLLGDLRIERERLGELLRPSRARRRDRRLSGLQGDTRHQHRRRARSSAAPGGAGAGNAGAQSSATLSRASDRSGRQGRRWGRRHTVPPRAAAAAAARAAKHCGGR